MRCDAWSREYAYISRGCAEPETLVEALMRAPMFTTWKSST